MFGKIRKTGAKVFAYFHLHKYKYVQMAMTKKTHLRSSAYIVFYICAHVHFFTNAKIAQVLPCAILRNAFYFTH